MTENRKDVLLVISTLGFAEESAAYAIEKAASLPGSQLHLLLVCENEKASIADRLSEDSWMGDKVGCEISEALSRDRRTRGYRVLSGVAHEAESEDVSTTTQVVEGNLTDEVRHYAAGHSIIEAVLSLPAPGLLERLLPGKKNPGAKLESALGIPVKIFHFE